MFFNCILFASAAYMLIAPFFVTTHTDTHTVLFRVIPTGLGLLLGLVILSQTGVITFN